MDTGIRGACSCCVAMALHTGNADRLRELLSDPDTHVAPTIYLPNPADEPLEDCAEKEFFFVFAIALLLREQGENNENGSGCRCRCRCRHFASHMSALADDPQPVQTGFYPTSIFDMPPPLELLESFPEYVDKRRMSLYYRVYDVLLLLESAAGRRLLVEPIEVMTSWKRLEKEIPGPLELGELQREKVHPAVLLAENAFLVNLVLTCIRTGLYDMQSLLTYKGKRIQLGNFFFGCMINDATSSGFMKNVREFSM